MEADFEIYHCLETAGRRVIRLRVGKLGRRGEMGYFREDRTESRSGKRRSVTSGITDL